MLRFLRTKATSFFIKALFGMIIVVFVFWGIGTFRAREKVVAEIGKYRIYHSEYYEEYRRLLEFYRNLLKEKFDDETLKNLKIKEKAMENILDRYLLLLIADKIGVDVSDTEYTEYIEGIEAFKKEGRFDKKRFLEVLKRNNIDPKDFERKERISLRIAKLSEILKDLSVSLNENDVWEEYKRENGMVRFKYSVFSPEDFKEKIRIDERELENRYEKEKEIHVSETVYQLKYIIIDEKGPIRDDKAYMELIKTKNLESFAKAHGLEVYNSGFVSETDFRQRFKDVGDFTWLKDLRKGDISLPVRVGTKSYIFQLVEYKKGEPLEKAYVLRKIKEKMALEKAKELAKSKANEALEKGNPTFEKLTDLVKRNSTNIPNIGTIPEEDRILFYLDGKNPIYKKPVEISGRFYIFSFDSEKLPEKEVWEKRKKEYQNYVLLKKREEAVKDLINSFKEREKVRVYSHEL